VHIMENAINSLLLLHESDSKADTYYNV